MLSFADLVEGLRITGLGTGAATVLHAAPVGEDAVKLVYSDAATGETAEVILFSDDLQRLQRVDAAREWTFDGDGQLFRLAAEAQRINLAHQFDPLLAVHISAVDPLPHQIDAVYAKMLPRQPLRFLLADDPGAGKTIMAGLLIRELILRGDVERCLIVTPANLAEQWQDEMYEKFHQEFEIASRADFVNSPSGNPLNKPELLLIGRIDLLKQEEPRQLLAEASEWDLVVVDEAHKMSARWNGNDVHRSLRYRLGATLAEKTRHFLLMTATPHSGNEDNFQLFLRLLDADRFAGKNRSDQRIDPSDLMRRVLKEDLTDFDGKPLFPERIATTVGYRLSPSERGLYERVTQYVSTEMGRAEQLAAKRRGKQRRSAVGFALTVLQRRLASSPAAIHESLKRRLKRLQSRLRTLREISDREELRLALERDAPLFELLGGSSGDDLLEDLEERPEAEISELLDMASAAESISELENEVAQLRELERLAKAVRLSGEDRKWEELAKVLEYGEMFETDGKSRRKLVIFTEHRDTLEYLVQRIGALLGQAEAVTAIHGGLPREQRRDRQHRFVNDPRVLILVATDAAGEGVNLERAHLMVNYDLPWNPNRIEQRFGRIHRFGQRNVCHLWNLVARETREGAVFERLLLKLEQERKALGDKVFDILGDAFTEVTLRDLMLKAIQYDRSEEARQFAERQIELQWDHDALRRLVEERSLDATRFSALDLNRMRKQIDLAAARRLAPHYLERFFVDAFEALGGSIRKREPGRYEISRLPQRLREYRAPGGRRRLQERYERVCFDRALSGAPGKDKPSAELLAPGGALLQSVVDVLLNDHAGLLRRGAALVDHSGEAAAPRAMIALEHSIRDGRSRADGRPEIVWRSIDYVEIDESGAVAKTGPAPYLDYLPLAPGQQVPEALSGAAWLRGEELEQAAKAHAVGAVLKEQLDELRRTSGAQLERAEGEITKRLRGEIAYWDNRAHEIRRQELDGKTPKINSANARRTADRLEQQLKHRRRLIEQQRTLTALPPRIISVSLIVPAHLLDAALPSPDPVHSAEIERLAMEAVIAYEHAQGREPEDVSDRKLGWDVESRDPENGQPRYIEVKGRQAGAAEITLTVNEILQAANLGEQFWLAVALIENGAVADLRLQQDPTRGDLTYALKSGRYDIDKLMEERAAYNAAR